MRCSRQILLVLLLTAAVCPVARSQEGRQPALKSSKTVLEGFTERANRDISSKGGAEALPLKYQLEGRFRDLGSGNKAFVTKEGTQISVDDSLWKIPSLGKNASTFPATVEVIVDRTSGAPFSLSSRFGKTGLKGLENLQTACESAKDPTLKKLLDGYSKRLEKLSLDAVASKDMDGLVKAVDGFDKVQSNIVSDYLKLPENLRRQQSKELGTAYLAAARSRKQSASKVSYGYDDQYTPETYPLIYERCQSVAAIRYSGTVIGTCFLIGKNLVLTCRHCLRDDNDQELLREDLDIVFDPKPAIGSRRTYNIIKVVYEGANQSQDFTLLQVGLGENTPEKDRIPILPLDTRNSAKLKRSVYVIGFPKGQGMMVADASHVLVPHVLSEGEYAAIELSFNGELAEARTQSGSLGDAFENDLIARFVNSFTKDTVGGQNVRLFHSAMLASPSIPAIAIDSNTFHGNSGSPVFERKTSTVVALFSRGWPDDPWPVKVGLQKHEEAIPIGVILRAWRDATRSKPIAEQPEGFGLTVP